MLGRYFTNLTAGVNYTVAANSFAADGDTLIGEFAISALSSETISVSFGGTTFLSAAAANGQDCWLRFMIIRSGSSSARCFGTLICETAGVLGAPDVDIDINDITGLNFSGGLAVIVAPGSGSNFLKAGFLHLVAQ